MNNKYAFIINNFISQGGIVYKYTRLCAERRISRPANRSVVFAFEEGGHCVLSQLSM